MKAKIKDNFSYILLFVCVFFLAFIVNKNTALFGDDFYYATFRELGFLKTHIEHYEIVNGRAIVHLLATAFLMLPIWVWQVLNSIMLAGISTLSLKIAIPGKCRADVWMFALSSLCLLSVDITRESVYWLTGSFNYVYPFLLLLAFWYFLIKSEKKHYKLLYIFAFFSSATTEQNGMMTLGVLVLYILDSLLIKRRNPGKKIWLLALPVILGFLSVYLSPATFVRFGLETEKGMLDIIKETFPRLSYDFFAKKYMRIFAFINFAAMGLYIMRFSKSFVGRFVGILNIIAVMSVYFISKTPFDLKGQYEILALYVIGIILFFDILFIFINLIKRKPYGYLTPIIAVILAFGSQIMMTASPVSGPRTMLCAILNLIIFDLFLLKSVSDKRLYKVLAYILASVCLILGISNQISVWDGYRQNVPVYRENEAIIEKYKQNPTGEFDLYVPKNPDHCWSMPNVSIYHEGKYKIYHGINLEDKINWIKP